MALKVSTDGKIPENCIKLTVEEAITYQYNQIKNWPERWDVWPYFYGIPTLGFIAGVSGSRINDHYRLKLKLRRYGYMSTSLAITFTPVIFAVASHFLFVSTDMILERNKCILCLQTQAIGLQLFSSIIYPAIMSPTGNFMFAIRHGTYPLPYWKDYKNTLKLWLSMNKTLAPKLKFNIPIQILVAGFVTYMEAKSLYTVRSKIENTIIEDSPEIDIQ